MSLKTKNYIGIIMENKKTLTLVSLVACIPLLAQATPLIDSKSINKQVDNKNTGTITIMSCAPYPLCAIGKQAEETKPSQDKPKKKSS